MQSDDGGGYITDEELELRQTLQEEEEAGGGGKQQQQQQQQQQQHMRGPPPPAGLQALKGAAQQQQQHQHQHQQQQIQSPSREVLIADNGSRRCLFISFSFQEKNLFLTSCRSGSSIFPSLSPFVQLKIPLLILSPSPRGDLFSSFFGEGGGEGEGTLHGS